MNPPNLSLLFIMACFWLTYWVVLRFLVKPVSAVADERRRRVDGAETTWASKHQEYLSATERLESEMEEAAREAGRVRAELRRQGQALRQERLDAARHTIDGRLQEALAEIGRQETDARAELRQRAHVLAAELASRLLERRVAS